MAHQWTAGERSPIRFVGFHVNVSPPAFEPCYFDGNGATPMTEGWYFDYLQSGFAARSRRHARQVNRGRCAAYLLSASGQDFGKWYRADPRGCRRFFVGPAPGLPSENLTPATESEIIRALNPRILRNFRGLVPAGSPLLPISDSSDNMAPIQHCVQLLPRITALRVIAVVAIVSVFAQQNALWAADAKRPNVVIILADDKYACQSENSRI